jgi:hypothetical protein
MANTFATQTKFSKAVAFQWKAFEGFADHATFRNDLLPGAVDNTGYTVNLRRPSRHATTATAVAADYSLPGVTQPVVAYGNMVDVSVPFTILQRFETDLQASIEEMTFKLEAKDVMDRHITPAIIEHRNKINAYIAAYMETAAGNTIVTDGTSDGYVKGLFDASALLTQRAGLYDNSEATVIFNPRVMPVMGLGNAKVYQAAGADKTWSNAKFQPIAGFGMYQSPLLSTPTVTALGAGAVVAASYNVTPLLTAPWTQTWSVDLTGVTNNLLVKAGSKIKFTTSGTDINWCVANSGGTIDAGYVATFTVVSNAQTSADGAVTLTLSEPFIAGGDYKNVVSNLVAGTTAVSLATSAGLLRPSYAFAKDAVFLGSPAVKIPKGVDDFLNLKVGGFNIAFVDDHWAGTLQSIHKLVSFIAVAVPKPEGIVALY